VVYVYLLGSPADEPVYKTLEKQCSEGKKWLVCMTAAMNKLIKVYYARMMEHFKNLSELEPTSESTLDLVT
jgi:hypothetical protein